MIKILVTGSAGFIGKRLVLMISKSVKSSDILSYIHTSEKNPFSDTLLKVKKVELLEKSSLEVFDKAPSAVFHLAASTDTSSGDHRSNYIGTKNLLASLGELGEDNHIIFTSSTAVYAGRKDCSHALNGKTPVAPSNEYGRTKMTAERFLAKMSKKRKFRLTIVRLSTVYGKGTRKNGLFDILRKAIKAQGLISRLNWPGLTSLVHVDDAASALIKISQRPPSPGKPEIFVVYSESLSLAGISKLMHKKMGIRYRQVPLPGFCWKALRSLKSLSVAIEAILPPKLYNIFWRVGLVTEDALHCESTKFFKKFPGWRPRRFEDSVGEVV